MISSIQPRIVRIPAKKLVGRRITMSLIDNQTRNLWAGFMPLRKEIGKTVGNELYSVQLYDPGYFDHFSPATQFEKWAAVEVTDSESIPSGLEEFSLPEGLYAVFAFKGCSGDGRVFEYIFTCWLPESNYDLDDRPHFEVLGEKYRNDDVESEEEIWIPVKHRRADCAQTS